MKKVLLIMALFAISFAGKAQQHYDFSAVNETGLSLYYKITSDANRTVEVVYPHVEGNYWGGYTKPTGSLIIPSSVTHDGVDYTVVSIGEFAFYECTGLTAVTVGSSICEVYSYAFGHCSNLSSIELPDQMYKIENRAFSGTALTEIMLPSSLSLIGEACFSDCNSLVSITIPANVTEIGRMAFLNCHSLQSVTFNDSLQKIWDSAFENCSSLTEVEIPNSVTQIRWSAFRSCTNLSTVTIGTGTTEIQQYAFKGCTALETVNFNAINCTVSDEACFCDSPRFKNLNIGEEVQLIDDFAFTNCNSITKLVIPNSVTTIKSRAFKECRSLDSIVIGNSLQSLADDAFVYCGDSLLYISVNQDNPYFDTRNNCNAIIRTSTEELVLGSVNTIIPDGIISIGNYAFTNRNMTSINIPRTVQTIGNESFHNCYWLDTIICNVMTPPSAYPTTFIGCGNYGFETFTKVYVPYGTSQLYRNANGWNYFSNFIERGMVIGGAEWYYEIQNVNGSITYQHLQQDGDTVINHKDVKIIVRTNTLYDKHQEITHEYVYEENDVVYWWDKENESFTVLYDQNAETDDEWQITKGGRSIIVHVDEVSEYEYDGRIFKMMHVSDENDVFTGNIVCGIGHLTSWFPERIMHVYRDSRVEGLRCYWIDGDLILKNSDKDCDAVYEELHFGIDETANASFTLYPNPTNGTLYIENQGDASTFSISNMLGQTVMTGNIAGNQTVDVSRLDDGMYFIRIGQRTVKFVVRR